MTNKDKALINAWARAYFATDLPELDLHKEYSNCFIKAETYPDMGASVKKEICFACEAIPKEKPLTWATPEEIFVSNVNPRSSIGEKVPHTLCKECHPDHEGGEDVKSVALDTETEKEWWKITSISFVKDPEPKYPLELSKQDPGEKCVQCKKDYPYAEKEVGFACWACRNGF